MKVTALFITLLTVTLFACQSESGMITQNRSLPVFSSVVLNGLGTVRLRFSETQEVRVNADASIIDLYETEVVGDTLYIGYRKGFSFTYLKALKNLNNCEVDITAPELISLELNGSGLIISNPFYYNELDIRLSGSGRIETSGAAEELFIDCNGSGRVIARDLISKKIRIVLTGAGLAEINAEDEIEASLTGSGKIIYWGNPAVTKTVSGSGDIIQAKK